MNAAQIADQAINKIEAEEQGILPPADDSKKTDDKGGDDDKSKETPKNKPADDDGDKKRGADDKDAGNDKGDEKPGEFTADDAIESDAPKAPENKAPTDSSGVVLSTAEQKHIADNIGEPIVIRGTRGTGDNIKEVEIKAYSPADIPADFSFANDQQRMSAQTGFYNLEQKANQLLGNFRTSQSQATAQDYERRENEGIRADVADLQKDGRFPKFRVRPGEKGFDDTPEAQQMSDVLKLMAERNELYLKQYEQGRPYKHIGFSEAFELWEKTNPGKQAEKKANDDQKTEDETRKKAAERGDSNRGTTTSNIRKPTVRPGTTTRDILARIEAEE